MNYTYLLRTATVLLCSLLSITIYGQKPGETNCTSKNGSLVINEVGNISESKYGDNAGEFIELLVIGDDPTIPVNLEGYVIDDNYNSSAKNGVTPGHVKLGSCFSEVMPGTIIILYDDQRQFPGINSADNGTPNTNGVFQVPFNSSCLIKVSDCPTYSSGDYGCTTGVSGGGFNANTGGLGTPNLDWRDFLHLNDAKDVVQVRNIDNELVHALMWWPIKGADQETVVIQGPKSLIFPDQDHPNAVKVHDGDVGGKTIAFVDGDYLKKENYRLLSDVYRPGIPNNNKNVIFIDELKPLVCPGEPIDLGCEGNSDYCYIWDNNPNIVPQRGGIATIYPSESGQFNRTTLDGDGNIVGQTAFFVRTYPGFATIKTEQQLTAGDCLSEVDFRFTVEPVDAYDSYTYLWSNGETTQEVEVPGGEVYTVTVTGENGCQVVETFDPVGDPSMLGQVTIEASTPMLCGDSPVQLTTSFQNYSGNGNRTYEWSNGSTTAMTQVTVAGEYRVTVTTSAGCTFTDEIEIDPGFSMSIIADADQACAENAVHLTPQFTGQPGLGLYYEWSTGANTQDIFVTEGGEYTLDLITADGCVLTSSVTIRNGVEVQVAATANRLIPGEQVVISPTVTGGTAPYSYSWSSGQSSSSISVNSANDYTVTVTDALGCTATASTTILPFDEDLCEGISASIVFHEPDCDYYGSARLEALLSSEFDGTTFEWSTGFVGPDLLIDDGNTSYSVTVTASNGCQTSATIQAPDFETLRPSFASTTYCALVDRLNVVSLGENQAVLVIDDYTQAQLDALLHGAGGITLEFTASYRNIDGEDVYTTLPFSSTNLVPNPATWAGNLVNVQPGTDIRLGMEIRIFNLCPIICDKEKSITYEEVADEDEAVVEENPEILLTDYDCGDQYFPDSADINTQPLQFLNPGEIITVNGFPILIHSLDGNDDGQGMASSDGFYTGIGVVPTPWND